MIEKQDPEAIDVAKSHLTFPVVGIGASAGGVSALQAMFAQMPADTGMAFVVVMHLSPDHESALGQILQRSCKLVVVTVAESCSIQADHIYVISPSKKLAMTDGELQVSDMTTLQGRHRSIDLFFRSLAQAHQERAVCIVLSGTGGDGAQGLKRVKELGGVAIAQSPEDAEFNGMPKAAIQTGAVDFVLPAAEMPAKLALLWENARRIALPAPPADLVVARASGEANHLAEEALVSIKALLRERTGHNFTHYKRATVLRRLERRMQVNALPDLPSYRRFLDAEASETPALLQDMLISVTNFFRDPEAFDALTDGLRKFVAGRPPGEPFRAWIAGCATGEEAYSVAIVLKETLAPFKTPVQIFASDIDARAVALARAGLYPASIATDVSAQRLRDNFVEAATGYRIAKTVRDGVVFSLHNALSDPPFTRMDLICCRNLLIYLDRSAQAQLLRSFHFAAKPKGLLFLGSSETTDAAEGFFVSEDKRHRLYHASESVKRSLSLPSLPSLSTLGSATELPPSRPRRASITGHPLDTLHERVMARLAPATVLVDADDNALHVDERAAHLLRLPAGAPSNKLMALARPELRAELRSALARAAETGRSVQARRVRLTINGQPRFIGMSARPAGEASSPGLFLVVFDESEETMVPDGEAPAGHDPVLESLESQLIRVEEELRDTRGEASASTEELRASNEELQTINEELRSTSEELETSREELQAVNEELTTVNGELNAKIEETSKANDDLHNLMVSAEIGAVFVDREMRVKRFTPQAATLFNLLRSDVGRPLLDITHRLDYPELVADAGHVLRDLHRIEREVRAIDGRWFLARVLPYRTSEDHIDGMIFAFFDVSSRKAAEELLRLSEQRMRLVADSMRDYAILTTDAQGVISTWSPGAVRVFGYTPAEAIGQPFALIFTLEDRQAGAPAEEMRKAREQGRAPDDRWHMKKGGKTIYCSGTTTPLMEGGLGLVGYAKIARDFTDAEMREQQREAALQQERIEREKLQEASIMKDEFLAVMSHELKNPLAVIQMSASLLTRLPTFQSEPRAVRATDAIKSAVASQAQIINDLLELSQVNMGKIVLHLAPVDLGELVRGIVDAVSPDMQAKHQQLELAVADGTTVVADSVRVEQIVWNLLTNAIKFTPEDGSIRVSLAVGTDRAELTVADSGIGMEPGMLDDVFEMFRQVDAGTSRKKTGLGIGLALVKQLTVLHGGRVKASSEGLGRGSTFEVWLPLATPATVLQEVPEPSFPRSSLAGLKILLVDDEPVLLAAFADLLEPEGASVVTVGQATLAAQLVQDEDFDVVISDIAMPEHDGYWLARQLRASGRGARLAIVAVSGMARETDRQKAFHAGFDAHVGKPLDFDRLRLEIERAVTRRRLASQ